jgi:hypothetical protein
MGFPDCHVRFAVPQVLKIIRASSAQALPETAAHARGPFRRIPMIGKNRKLLAGRVVRRSRSGCPG